MTTMFRSFVLCLCAALSLSGNVNSHSTGEITMQDMIGVFKDMIDVSEAASEAKMAKMQDEFMRRQEASEKEISALKAKIETMESKMKELASKEKTSIETMESDTKLKELALQTEGEALDATTESETDDSSSRQQDEDNISEGQKRQILSGDTKRQSFIRKGRGISETEVAFYATGDIANINHLGVNQVIPFRKSVTNVGNAYNTITSAFVAPVAGTYVLHMTILALQSTESHFRAHFDINGGEYSVISVTPYDQSSQMLVINLNVGDTVTVRNDYKESSVYSVDHTTFSGFLLYEHNPSVAAVGK